MASRGINKVILVGNVGRDPEIKSFPNGENVASCFCIWYDCKLCQ